MKRVMGIISAVALTTSLSYGELVGSLLWDSTTHTNTGLIITNGVPTRTVTGDVHTRGTVEGYFHALAGADLGVGGYAGMTLRNAKESTGANTRIVQYRDLNRYKYSNSGGGVLAWDFDFSGQSHNAWLLQINFGGRRGLPNDTDVAGEWYVSFNGLGRTLDTTAFTGLNPGDMQGIILDPTTYVKVGELAAMEKSGLEAWNITEIVEAAQSSDGLIRIVYVDNEYLADINLSDETGVIGTNVTTNVAIKIPEVYLVDRFDDGSGTSTTNSSALINDWTHSGPETKEYNVGSSGFLDIRDEILLVDETNGSFDRVEIAIPSLALTNDGDWLEFSFDIKWLEGATGNVVSSNSSPLAVVTLVESARTNQAGYGFRIQPVTYHWLYEAQSATAFPSSSDHISAGFTLRGPTTNETFDTWFLRIERSGTNCLLSPLHNGKMFGGTEKRETFTDSGPVDAVFDLLTFNIRQSDVRMQLDNVVLISNVEIPELTLYDVWAQAYGLDVLGEDAKTDNPDSDAQDNFAEYVFGGNPTNDAVLGVAAALDGSGNYVYTLRNDNGLVATVLTRLDLILGSWSTNSSFNIAPNDGGLSVYTNSVPLVNDEEFIKLEVQD